MSEEIRRSVERMADSLRAGLIFEAFAEQDVSQVHAYIGELDSIMLALITDKMTPDLYDALDTLYTDIEEFGRTRPHP